ncbi:MAG: hypothetical protein U0264_05465 [Candidatus Kapaibacterium sp.]
MAINITTISVIMTKLKEISDKLHGNFSATKSAMRSSIFEQVGLIVAAIILLMLKKSTIQELVENNFYWQSGFHAVFIGAINILIDTARTIFIILDFEEKRAVQKDRGL